MLHNGCDHLSMLGFKLHPVSKRSPLKLSWWARHYLLVSLTKQSPSNCASVMIAKLLFGSKYLLERFVIIGPTHTPLSKLNMIYGPSESTGRHSWIILSRFIYFQSRIFWTMNSSQRTPPSCIERFQPFLNHQRFECLPNRLFMCESKKTKHQSSASLVFVWAIHRWPVNSPH